MQTSTGRGTGSALAILTIGVVALAMTALVLLIRPTGLFGKKE